MPKYSDALHPEVAAYEFGGLPGNYVLFDRWGRAYAGRQSSGGYRIGKHLRDHPGEFVSAHVMVDGYDDPCVRATREDTAVKNLADNGVRLRNVVKPSLPKKCDR
jgi:hypothetical protein